MRNEQNAIGDYSTSPAGQGCLWVAAIGVIGILCFSYVGSYTGAPQDPLDHIENGIAGATRPTYSETGRYAHAHRHRVHRRSVEQID